MFQSISNRQKSIPQAFNQISKTQKIGYISAQQRIESIMRAGYQLKEYRQEQYDFKSLDTIDESLNDPTRSKGFDLADATQLSLASMRRSEEQKMALEEESTNRSEDIKKLDRYKKFMKDESTKSTE